VPALKRVVSSSRNDLEQKDIDQPGSDVMQTFLLIIDVYSERYPHRKVFLKAETSAMTKVYHSLVETNLTGLMEIFKIDFSPEIPSLDDGLGTHHIGFVLSRKPIPYINLTSIETFWTCTSRLFHSKVTVQMEKTLRMAVAMPRENS
jgi:hypothetical protein